MTKMTVTPPIPGARVLVVDDELQVRSALVRSLDLLGYRVLDIRPWRCWKALPTT
jgi:CheY-like chemotaxis protein